MKWGKKASSTGSHVDRFYVLLHVGKPLLWEVTREGVLEVSHIPQDAFPVLSFDEFDRRQLTVKAMSGQRAKKCFLREHGERTRVINRSRQSARIYGRSVEKVAEFDFRITPGSLCLDKLLGSESQGPRSRISGFLFGRDDDYGRKLALLFAFDANGEVVKFQEAIDPQNIELLLEELARANGIDLAASETMLFSQRDVFNIAKKLPTYPVADDWNGIRTDSVYAATALLLASGVGVNVSLAGYHYIATRQLAAQTAQLQRDTSALKSDTEADIQRNIKGFADALSVSHRELFSYAEMLWKPGTKVSLTASRQKEDYLVKVDTDAELPGLGTSSERVSKPRPHEAISAALDATSPKGLTLTDLSATGDFNVFYVKYSRTKVDSVLGRLVGN